MPVDPEAESIRIAIAKLESEVGHLNQTIRFGDKESLTENRLLSVTVEHLTKQLDEHRTDLRAAITAFEARSEQLRLEAIAAINSQRADFGRENKIIVDRLENLEKSSASTQGSIRTAAWGLGIIFTVAETVTGILAFIYH